MAGARRPWNVATERPRHIRKQESMDEIEFCMRCPFPDCRNCLNKITNSEKERMVMRV